MFGTGRASPSRRCAPLRLRLRLRSRPARQADLERSQRQGFFFAAKLVRGAYMQQERALAAEKGMASPVHASLAETHACYEQCLDLVRPPAW